MNTAIFESFDPARRGWSGRFSEPQAVHEAHTPEQVRQALEAAADAASRGCWSVVALSYEAAAAFDSALTTRPATQFPLAWVGIYDRPDASPIAPAPAMFQAGEWRPQIVPADYHRAVERVRDYIAAGETYQTNLTFPLSCDFSGEARAWYRQLGMAQGAGYCCYLDLGRYRVLSLSPELFFERRGNRLITRPMKGTMRRGRWLEEDEERSRNLAASHKNRAENLMIVDLLRNDLGRISIPGTVQVSGLFEVEKYETLWQMTSTITAECRPETTLPEIFRALFPGGSITGAPKIRTMQIISELESFPRQIYTGAIGFIRPGGDCVFNIAIRTILLDLRTGIATFGVGGGITYDSTPEDEYDECRLKASFLGRSRPEFSPEFRLLETLLLDEGEYFLLDRHLARIGSSARYFGFSWDEDQVKTALDLTGAERGSGSWRVRLLTGRDGSLEIETHRLPPDPPRPRRVALSAQPIDLRDPFIYHKTTHRPAYEQARNDRPDCDDLIFWNERGEITESSLANVVLLKDGIGWTPPRDSGLLAGTFRNHLLESGEIRERAIHRDELRSADSIYLINSVRRWMPAVLIG